VSLHQNPPHLSGKALWEILNLAAEIYCLCPYASAIELLSATDMAGTARYAQASANTARVEALVLVLPF